MAIRAQADNSAVSVNGETTVVSSEIVPPTNVLALYVSPTSWGSNSFDYYHVRQIIVLPRALSNVELQNSSLITNQLEINTHLVDTDNPHNVTKAQVGLGDVDNTADVDKPVSTAQLAKIYAAVTQGTMAAPLIEGEQRAAAFDFERWAVMFRDITNPALNFVGRPDDIITMTRASDATYFDENGVMQVAGPNTMRRSRVPETGRMGFLSEWSSTNLWANTVPTGGTVGVIGSGGSLPAGWSNANKAGLTVEILAIEPGGIEDGVPGIAVRISGTGNGTVFRLSMSSPSYVTQDLWYTTSGYVRAVAGSLVGMSNIHINCVNGGPSVAFPNPFAATRMADARSSYSSPMSSSNPGGGRFPELRFTAASGEVIDITFLVGAAQFEQREFLSSYIPTTTVAATRSADNARINLSALPWSSEHFCIIADFDSRTFHSADGHYRSPFGLVDGGGTNGLVQQRLNSTSNRFGITSSNAALTNGVLGRNRVAAAFSSDGNARISANGGTVASRELALDPSILTRFNIGHHRNGQGTLAGHLHSLVVLPRNPTDLEMQGWSTLP